MNVDPNPAGPYDSLRVQAARLRRPIEEERMHCSSCGAGVAEGTAFCGSCGRPIVGYNVGGHNVAAPPVAPLPGGTIAPPYTAAAGVTYAGFWLRAVASIIDGLVLMIPV